MHLFHSPHIPPSEHRFFVAAQLVFISGLILHAIFIPLFYYFGVLELVGFNFLSVSIFSLCLFVNFKGLHSMSLWLALTEATTHAVLSVYFLGWDAGFTYYLLLAAPLVFLYTKMPVVQKAIVLILPAVLFVMLHRFSLTTEPVYFVAASTLYLVKYFNIISTMSILSYLTFFYSNAAETSEAQLHATSLELEKMATTDTLTNLLNRRALNEEIKKEVVRHKRLGTELVFALGDIDNFKQINDKYGHLCGDIVLKYVAQVLKDNFRQGDLIGRWGGEEFLVLLVGANNQQAEAVTDMVRQEIEKTAMDLNGAVVNISITFGVCAYSMPHSVEECLHYADQGLYKGKLAGKNCVVSTTPETHLKVVS